MIDQDTYRHWFNEYFQTLCALAETMTNDKMLAQDAVQEVFIHLWQKRGEIVVKSDARYYLARSVRNKVLEQKRRPIVQNEQLLTQDMQENVAEDNSDDNFDHLLLMDKINTSIRHLPRQCGRIFALSKLEGKSNKEIAEELGLSIKTVEHHITKAYKTLRLLLKDYL